MKMLFCQDCRNLVVPGRGVNNVRRCACDRHAVWWSDPAAGELRVYDERGAGPTAPQAFVVGLSNELLWRKGADFSAEIARALIAAHAADSPVRHYQSLVFRGRPGVLARTAWADRLP